LESVHLVNQGVSPLQIADWTVIHMSSDGRHLRYFKFPLELEGNPQWVVGPEDVVVVFSGKKPEGGDTKQSIDRPREFRFWWGLSEAIWTSLEDTVAVRDEDGVVVNEASVRTRIEQGKK